MREFDSYDKMMHGWIDKAVSEQLPRQAQVVRTEGSTVWVRYTTESAAAPETNIPTLPFRLKPGDLGWVYPVAGGKGLFIPWTEGRYYTQEELDTRLLEERPVPFVHRSSTSGSSTTVGAHQTMVTFSQVLPAGTWRLAGSLGGLVRHSHVATPYLEINGLLNGSTNIGGANINGISGQSNNSWSAITTVVNSVVTSDGVAATTVAVRCYTGNAGTMTWANPWVDLTATPEGA